VKLNISSGVQFVDICVCKYVSYVCIFTLRRCFEHNHVHLQLGSKHEQRPKEDTEEEEEGLFVFIGYCRGTQMLLIKNNFHSMEYMSAFLGITHCVGTPAPTAPGWFSAFADGVRTRTTAEGA